ncbi:MAG: AtpZ/AtpI family protein [Rhodobacter sp.]|nr:AtpZ/AtpI family protein [Rhodobacter sp.]
MVDPEEKARLARLDARIKAAKGATEERPKIEEHHSQAQLAWRMVIELVAGVAIGFGLGYGLDVLLGTLPVFLAIMTVLGFLAGVRTMMRSAKEIQAEQAGDAPGEEGD